MQPETKIAFQWVVNILRKHQISFQITGGLAAIAYGATRALDDIDIDIPESAFPLIQEEVSSYTIFGPASFKSDRWDLYLQTLNYKSQTIDLGGAYKTKIFNQLINEWQPIPANFDKAEIKKLFDIEVPVIDRTELIDYKTALNREVDQIDIQQITKALEYI